MVLVPRSCRYAKWEAAFSGAAPNRPSFHHSGALFRREEEARRPGEAWGMPERPLREGGSGSTAVVHAKDDTVAWGRERTEEEDSLVGTLVAEASWDDSGGEEDTAHTADGGNRAEAVAAAGSRCSIHASAPVWRAWMRCSDILHSRNFTDMAENR
jgi:hypothetical protein